MKDLFKNVLTPRDRAGGHPERVATYFGSPCTYFGSPLEIPLLFGDGVFPGHPNRTKTSGTGKISGSGKMSKNAHEGLGTGLGTPGQAA